jgi:hypothetical protein
MGTRAFIQFPVYTFVESKLDNDGAWVPVWGDKEGDLFVYTQYDGDTLPCHLQVVLLEELKQKYPHEVPATAEQKLLQLEPQRVAALLVEDLYADNVAETSTRISPTMPKEGFHLICDLKAQTITYIDRDRTFPLSQWVGRDTGIVFTYEEKEG